MSKKHVPPRIANRDPCRIDTAKHVYRPVREHCTCTPSARITLLIERLSDFRNSAGAMKRPNPLLRCASNVRRPGDRYTGAESVVTTAGNVFTVSITTVIGMVSTGEIETARVVAA